MPQDTQKGKCLHVLSIKGTQNTTCNAAAVYQISQHGPFSVCWVFIDKDFVHIN